MADLAVKANARRIGVGTALMCAAEAWAREGGLPALSLDVSSTNERGDGTVTEPRLYQLIRQRSPVTEQTFEISFRDPDVQVYVFTFG